MIYLLLIAAVPVLVARWFLAAGARRRARARAVPLTPLDSFRRSMPGNHARSGRATVAHR